jgi:hypothetical protein
MTTRILALFCKGLLGFCVTAFFLLKITCSPEFWNRNKRACILYPPPIPPVQETDAMIATREAWETARRFLIVIRRLPTIGGLLLDHSRKYSKCPTFRGLFRLAFRQQLKRADSGCKSLYSFGKSDTENKGLSNDKKNAK